MTVSEVKRLKALKDENARLKKLLTEWMLDMAAMKELLAKNGYEEDQQMIWEIVCPTICPPLSRI